MIKSLTLLTFTCLYISSATVMEGCTVLKDASESACGYPSFLMLTSNPNKYRVNESNCNAEFNKSEWKEQPTVCFPNAKPGKTYTLINVDPDPLMYRKGQYWLHWLSTGIKGEDLMKGDFSNAKNLTVYERPDPEPRSGPHRYMYLLYEEMEKEKNRKLEAPESRDNFELGSWLKKQQKFCGPIAGIQFRTKF